jgi:hypothetical protein
LENYKILLFRIGQAKKEWAIKNTEKRKKQKGFVLIALKGQLPERHVVKTAPKGTQEKLGEGILNTGNTGRITDFVLVAERPCLMMKKQSA